MEYIKEGFTLPVPINIIPTSVAIIDFAKCIRRWLAKKKTSVRSTSISHTALDEPVSQYELKSQISGNNFNLNSSELPNKIALANMTAEATLRNTAFNKVAKNFVLVWK